MNRRNILLGLAGALLLACLGAVICMFRVDLAVAGEAGAPPVPAQTPPETADPVESSDMISAALVRTREWHFFDTPLSDVVEFVRKSSKLDLVVDARALEDAGLPADTPITCDLAGVSLRSFLGIVLEPIGLCLDRRDGALWITTREEAERHLSVRVYPVADLVRVRNEPGEAAYAYDDLIGVIRGNLAPESWGDFGGTGAIEGIYGSLVVSQADEIHEQLGQFLTALRQISGQHRQNPDGAGRPVFANDSKAHATILAALEQPIPLDVNGARLSEVVEFLSRSTGIPIVLDTRALADYGIAADVAVTARVDQLPLRFALRRMLDPVDLTWTIRHEVLLITTPEASEDNLTVCIYPVSDLAAPYAGASPEEYDFDSLIELMTSTVAPDSWEDGNGPARTIVSPPAIVIAQTERVHEQLRDLMHELRRAQRIEREAEKLFPPEEPRLLVHTYRLKPGHRAQDVLPLIIRLLGEDILDGEGVSIDILGNDLVVRHNRLGHGRIRSLLFDLSR